MCFPLGCDIIQKRRYRLYQQCTKEEAERILRSTREMVAWLKERIDEQFSPEK